MRRLIVPFLALACVATPAWGQAKKSDAVVKLTAEAEKPGADGKQVVTLRLAIDAGWHLYANPVGQEDLVDVQTVVVVGGKAEVVKIDYPAGELVKDKVVGDYRVYKDKVVIKATVKRGAAAEPLEVSVKLQACNDKQCLLPATVKTTVP